MYNINQQTINYNVKTNLVRVEPIWMVPLEGAGSSLFQAEIMNDKIQCPHDTVEIDLDIWMNDRLKLTAC